MVVEWCFQFASLKVPETLIFVLTDRIESPAPDPPLLVVHCRCCSHPPDSFIAGDCISADLPPPPPAPSPAPASGQQSAAERAAELAADCDEEDCDVNPFL